MARKKKPVGPVSDGNEYMVRWKRTTTTGWFYHPKVWLNKTEPERFIALAMSAAHGQPGVKHIQLVKLVVEVEWDSKDASTDTVQPAAVEPTVPKTG
jgi:hypothetical protein